MLKLKNLLKPIKIKKVEVHLSAVLLIVVALRMRFLNQLAISYVITALHEIAHIFVAHRLGVKIRGVEVLPFGITMRLGESGIKKPKDEIRVSLAGPLCNLVVAYLTYGFYGGQLRDFIICTSLAIGLFNLLPVLPLDGGRVLRSVLVMRYGCIKGSKIAMKVTATLSFFVVVAGAYVLYATGFNFSFLLIGGFLIANITEEKKSTNMIIMKDILYSRKKLSENGACKGEILVATEKDRAKTLLSSLSYDKYYMIEIVDSHMCPLCRITETQLIEGIAVYGMNVKMKKFAVL